MVRCFVNAILYNLPNKSNKEESYYPIFRDDENKVYGGQSLFYKWWAFMFVVPLPFKSLILNPDPSGISLYFLHHLKNK